MIVPLKLFAVMVQTSGVAVAVAYTGYVQSYLDHEVQTTFFIKRFPALQVRFYDPFANDGDDVPIDDLQPSDRQRLADYCKYRFGVVSSTTMALERCRTEIPRYLD